MYYHCRPLKYVMYDKVLPPPIDTYDQWDINLYRWIENYCGYFPQIWLSRSNSGITGMKRRSILKKALGNMRGPGTRNSSKINQDKILFGFDIIKGFPVSYDHWEAIMNSLMNIDSIEKQNKEIAKDLNELVGFYEEEKEALEGVIKDWVDSGRNLDIFLKKYVFIEKDQVVVPSLNLKSAKKIICRDERQKKTLRKMGFIEDRIQIKNIAYRPY